MKIVLSEKILNLLKEDHVGYRVIPINKLLVSEKGLRKSYNDISDGRYSKTNGPLRVWIMGGEYQLIDGYHRLVQYLLLGVKKVRIKINSGYTDYWAKTLDDDRFEFDLDSQFGGLEIFADDEILLELKEKLMDGEN